MVTSSVRQATSIRSAAASSPASLSLRPEVLNFVDEQFLLGEQHLDVGIDRGRVIAPEGAGERLCGFGAHCQPPFLEIPI